MRDADRHNRADFDATAEAYQAVAHEALATDLPWGPWVGAESDLHVLGDVQGLDVLDLGCGGGQTLALLGRRGARTLAGIDLSPRMLAHARRNVPDARLVEGSVEDLEDFADDSFDLAISLFSMGFVEDLERALREAARVVRPGGRVVISWISPIHEKTKLTGAGDIVLVGSWSDASARAITDATGTRVDFPRSYAHWIRAIARSGLVLDDALEPPARAPMGLRRGDFPWEKAQRVPPVTIWIARKR